MVTIITVLIVGKIRGENKRFMGLDKAIEHGKEHRRIYYGAQAIDCSCRNHGSCEWCKESRLYKNNKRIESMNEKIKEYKEEGWE